MKILFTEVLTILEEQGIDETFRLENWEAITTSKLKGQRKEPRVNWQLECLCGMD